MKQHRICLFCSIPRVTTLHLLGIICIDASLKTLLYVYLKLLEKDVFFLVLETIVAKINKWLIRQHVDHYCIIMLRLNSL